MRRVARAPSALTSLAESDQLTLRTVASCLPATKEHEHSHEAHVLASGVVLQFRSSSIDDFSNSSARPKLAQSHFRSDAPPPSTHDGLPAAFLHTFLRLNLELCHCTLSMVTMKGRVNRKGVWRSSNHQCSGRLHAGGHQRALGAYTVRRRPILTSFNRSWQLLLAIVAAARVFVRAKIFSAPR
jgi:hypothetical protein